jgi:hypothetical protein
MTLTLRKAFAGLAVVGALGLASAAPAMADQQGATGPGTAICGPTNGSFNAAAGPGYVQYVPAPADDEPPIRPARPANSQIHLLPAVRVASAGDPRHAFRSATRTTSPNAACRGPIPHG